jgi:hypothetical protein
MDSPSLLSDWLPKDPYDWSLLVTNPTLIPLLPLIFPIFSDHFSTNSASFVIMWLQPHKSQDVSLTITPLPTSLLYSHTCLVPGALLVLTPDPGSYHGTLFSPLCLTSLYISQLVSHSMTHSLAPYIISSHSTHAPVTISITVTLFVGTITNHSFISHYPVLVRCLTCTLTKH